MKNLFMAYKNEVHKVNIYPHDDEYYLFEYKDMNRLMCKNLEVLYIDGHGYSYCFDETEEGAISKYNKYVNPKQT